MARLPVPGQDTNVWGQILNDYLSVSLQSDGTLKLVAKSSLAPLNIGDSDVSAISQSKITNLTSALAAKISASIAQAKGDLLAASSSAAITNVPVGSDGQVLAADSTKTAGIAWKTLNSPTNSKAIAFSLIFGA